MKKYWNLSFAKIRLYMIIPVTLNIYPRSVLEHSRLLSWRIWRNFDSPISPDPMSGNLLQLPAQKTLFIKAHELDEHGVNSKFPHTISMKPSNLPPTTSSMHSLFDVIPFLGSSLLITLCIVVYNVMLCYVLLSFIMLCMC